LGIKLSDWLYKVSSGWLALVGLLIFLLFTALVLPTQSARDDASTADVGTPDLSFYYSADELFRMAEAYGEAGRTEYIRVRFTFDLFWPLVYTFFLTTSISWVYGRAFPGENQVRRVNIIPLLAMLFDYLENITTSTVIWRYPHQTPLLASLAGVFTTIKWFLVGGSFVILLVGIVIAVGKWIKNR
jgi:hypothetical protein